MDACANALVDEKALVKVKYRDSFRPFAPSVLREDVADWFELGSDSPYMLLVADVVERRRKPMTRAASYSRRCPPAPTRLQWKRPVSRNTTAKGSR